MNHLFTDLCMVLFRLADYSNIQARRKTLNTSMQIWEELKQQILKIRSIFRARAVFYEYAEIVFIAH